MPNNPLYSLLQGNVAQTPLNGLLGRLEAFKRNFHGDPRQQIQQMLNSGQITQAQYNQAVQTANSLFKIIGGKL